MNAIFFISLPLKRQNLYQFRLQRYKKYTNYAKILQKNLHISKKSSTFAPAFAKINVK